MDVPIKESLNTKYSGGQYSQVPASKTGREESHRPARFDPFILSSILIS